VFAVRGSFYEFHAERVISRPGQPLVSRTGIEIGPQVSRESAFRLVRAGKNVYTLVSQDAYQLAVQVCPGRPEHDDPHDPPQASPTGRIDVYFRHFHPGGDHDRFGHIFFGHRGERK
jgi:hypothetical protein